MSSRPPSSLAQALIQAKQTFAPAGKDTLNTQDALAEIEQLNRGVDPVGGINPSRIAEPVEEKSGGEMAPPHSPISDEFMEFLSQNKDIQEILDAIPDPTTIQKVNQMIRDINVVLKARLRINTETIIQPPAQITIAKLLNCSKIEMGCKYSIPSTTSNFVIAVTSNKIHFINEDVVTGVIEARLNTDEAISQTKTALFQKITEEVVKLYGSRLHRNQPENDTPNK